MRSRAGTLLASPRTALVAVAVAWGMFFAALSFDNSPRVSTGGGTRQGTAGPSNAAPSAAQQPGGGAGADAATSGDLQKASALERICPTFNIPELTMRRLTRILAEEFKLQVRFPRSASSLELSGLEQGGRPLGEILASLLGPHDLVFVRQGDGLEVLEAKVKHEGRRDDSTGGTVQDTDVRATLPVHAGEPAETWIDTVPPTELHFALQPASDESSGTQTLLTVDGRREGRSWFRHEIRATEGETVRVESKAEEWVWLTVRPMSLGEPITSLELRFHHEGIVSKP